MPFKYFNKAALKLAFSCLRIFSQVGKMLKILMPAKMHFIRTNRVEFGQGQWCLFLVPILFIDEFVLCMTSCVVHQPCF